MQLFPRKQSEWGHEPWLQRPDWRDGRIEQHHTMTVGSHYGTASLLAVLGVAFITLFLLAGKPWGAGVLGVPWILAGLYTLYHGFRKRERQRWHGDLVLALDDLPGALGATISGRIETQLPVALRPPDGFKVRLGCYHRHTKPDSDGGHKVVHTPLWYAETRMQGRPGADGRHLEIPFFFEVPSDQPESTPTKNINRIAWRIDVAGAFPERAFSAQFEVPVFIVEGRRTPEANPYAAWEHERTFRAPATPGIALSRAEDGGLRFDFGRCLYRKGAITAVIAFVIFTALTLVLVVPIFTVGYSAFFEAFPLNLLFLGLSFALGRTAWRYWFDASSVSVDDERIVVQRRRLGRREEDVLAASDLVLVEVTRRMDYAYDLHLIWAEPGPLREEALREREAERAALATQAVHTGGVATSDDGRGEALEALVTHSLKSGQAITVAERIADREEAEWIAQMIEDAARKRTGHPA